MPRESAEAKGKRYLTEGRLTVTVVRSPDTNGRAPVVAECRGSDTTYKLGYDDTTKTWRCTCPAKTTCAHLVALQLVTRKPG